MASGRSAGGRVNPSRGTPASTNPLPGLVPMPPKPALSQEAERALATSLTDKAFVELARDRIWRGMNATKLVAFRRDRMSAHIATKPELDKFFGTGLWIEHGGRFYVAMPDYAVQLASAQEVLGRAEPLLHRQDAGANGEFVMIRTDPNTDPDGASIVIRARAGGAAPSERVLARTGDLQKREELLPPVASQGDDDAG
jgi:hypothetical protein